MLALLYPICADINCTSFPSSKQALIAENFKFTDGCRGCSAVLTPRKPFGFCQGLSRFAIHVYNACFDGYPSRRMTSAIDCVASYIASAFSFCSLVYIIPSFPPVQDFVRRLQPAPKCQAETQVPPASALRSAASRQYCPLYGRHRTEVFFQTYPTWTPSLSAPAAFRRSNKSDHAENYCLHLQSKQADCTIFRSGCQDIVGCFCRTLNRKT